MDKSICDTVDTTKLAPNRKSKRPAKLLLMVGDQNRCVQTDWHILIRATDFFSLNSWRELLPDVLDLTDYEEAPIKVFYACCKRQKVDEIPVSDIQIYLTAFVYCDRFGVEWAWLHDLRQQIKKTLLITPVLDLPMHLIAAVFKTTVSGMGNIIQDTLFARYMLELMDSPTANQKYYDFIQIAPKHLTTKLTRVNLFSDYPDSTDNMVQYLVKLCRL